MADDDGIRLCIGCKVEVMPDEKNVDSDDPLLLMSTMVAHAASC
jgi:hypothetical protein